MKFNPRFLALVVGVFMISYALAGLSAALIFTGVVCIIGAIVP